MTRAAITTSATRRRRGCDVERRHSGRNKTGAQNIPDHNGAADQLKPYLEKNAMEILNEWEEKESADRRARKVRPFKPAVSEERTYELVEEVLREPVGIVDEPF
jgi:hypothetical protein